MAGRPRASLETGVIRFDALHGSRVDSMRDSAEVRSGRLSMATIEACADAAARTAARWTVKLVAAYMLGCLFGYLLFAIGIAMLVAAVEI